MYTPMGGAAPALAPGGNSNPVEEQTYTREACASAVTIAAGLNPSDRPEVRGV